MAYGKVLSVLLVALLLIPPAEAQTEEERTYISHPGNIPLMSNFSTPQLVPGDTGELRFSLTNRYNMTITDISIIVEIYLYANIHESKELHRVKRVPQFIGNVNHSASFNWLQLETDEKRFVNDLYVKTRESTEQGTYFVRFELSFVYNGHTYIMKSRGHFNDTQWDEATTNANETHPGNINITALHVNGIIPDTTFGVKKPWPRWPLYLLMALTVMFAALAIMTYMYEENTNPEFTRWVHKKQRKLGERRELILHELGKFKRKG